MKFTITSQFGAVESVRGNLPHNGIDLAVPMDTPLHSFCDGIIERVVDYGKENIGKGVILRANDGTRYIWGHLDKVSVQEGSAVHTGSLLGLSGSSGHSTGAHVHFGEWVKGKFVDPSNVIAKVDQYTGALPHKSLLQWITSPSDVVQDYLDEAVTTTLASVGDAALHLGYAVVLIGSGILIVLKQLGFEHRWLKPSVLIGVYVLVRYLFG